MDASVLIISGIVTVGILLLVSFILIGVSVKIVNVDEYGLEKNENEKTIDSTKLYRGGRYWVGLGHSFIKFPRAQQGIVFSNSYSSEKDFDDEAKITDAIYARTSEGLIITLEVALQYKLTTSDNDETKASQLWNIYSNFEEDYEKIICIFTEQVLKDISSTYKAYDFFLQRAEIGQVMFTSLAKEMYYYNFELKSLVLLTVDFPGALQTAITETAVAEQEVMKYKKLLEKEEILKETQISIAEKEKEIKIAKAESIADSMDLKKEGQKAGKKYLIQKYGEALAFLKTKLQDSTVDEDVMKKLLTFMWVKCIEKHAENLRYFSKLPSPLRLP